MKKYQIADAHCDFLYEAFANNKTLETHREGKGITLRGLIEGNVGLQVFAAWGGHLVNNAEERCLRQMDIYEEILNKYTTIKSYKNEGLPNDKTIYSVLAIEGGCLSSVDVLERCISRGVRIMSLTWNDANHLAGGVNDPKEGLTGLGKEFIRVMENHCILTDVSHLNEKSFDEVCCLTERPLIATHSNVLSVCDHPRNLSDRQIKEIIRRNGFIGIAFYPPFLGAQGTIDEVIRHMDHILSMGGEEVLGIGSDFDGISESVNGLGGSGDFPRLTQKMEKRGYSEETIKKICAGNFLRALKHDSSRN